MFTFPTTVAKNDKSPEIKNTCGNLYYIIKIRYINIIFFWIFDDKLIIFIPHKKNIFIHYYFISSLSAFTIHLFKISYVSLSQSIWAFFITYHISFLIYISLNITMEIDQNFPWSWSPLTTISIVDTEVLSDLLEHSWQYKLSIDVVKIFEISFVQKDFFAIRNKEITLWRYMILSQFIYAVLRNNYPTTNEIW